ncbi:MULTISPECIES: pyridoxamine 5'-phosphate oxidase family protein [unclassified Pseudofrankia]|uniref:pyridoxamine 5'-phosphate oxidase family protein n=1 Tax=unclassified Pseudofrankia TaxID=2994372 RepID=UPI0008D9CAB3|nr:MULTISPECIES: pyridoxamine 5'-phosphate oxidase family protein [unclassified Pseudofrankia]MDT3441584.1 pyridoxamine 5'-phosphate oxidase family protein [Pseudofrankia sp. BMG5.37]OHV45568.1 flavin-nucleotide-binding protein [Pseudofrankia sp. BMG5.36]
MPRTEATRLPELMSHNRADLDRLLASTVLGHVGFVDDDHPVVLPTAVVRWDDQLLIHGSTGSRWLRAIATGQPVSVSIAAIDGVLIARSAFESALLYRSAVLFGTFTPLTGTDKETALDILTDRIAPGRVAELRRPTARELAATLLLAMPIRQWSIRVLDDWPHDPADDVAGPAWAGQVRLGTPPLTVLDAPDLRPGIPTPPSATAIHGIR